MHAHAGGHQDVPVDLVDHREHVLHDRDHVRTRVAADGQGDHRLAVGEGPRPFLEMGQGNGGDVPQTDKGAVPLDDDHVGNRFDRREATDRAQQVAALAAVEVPARDVAVASPNGLAEVRQRDAALRQAAGIDLDAHLPFGAAAHVHLGHVRDALETDAHVVVDEVAHHGHVHRGRMVGQRLDAQVDERVVRERAGVQPRFVDVLRVRRHLAERVVDADQRLVDVDPERELQLDRSLAGRCFRDHALQARDVAQVLFLLDDDFFLDVLRRDPGPGGAHPDRANLEIGDHLHGHP
jgi:hypothetical protein